MVCLTLPGHPRGALRFHGLARETLATDTQPSGLGGLPCKREASSLTLHANIWPCFFGSGVDPEQFLTLTSPPTQTPFSRLFLTVALA